MFALGHQEATVQRPTALREVVVRRNFDFMFFPLHVRLTPFVIPGAGHQDDVAHQLIARQQEGEALDGGVGGVIHLTILPRWGAGERFQAILAR